MITGVNHITLVVRDVDRSYQFYVETLGSRPLARWSKGAYLLAGDFWLCLTLDERTHSSPLPEYSHIAFSVPAPRFDDAAASIRASGRRFGKITGARVPRSIFSIRTATSSKSMPEIGRPASPR
jgi:catechol 2,3-dioxygenase-like lactoylglutathione lyase family enzyme